MNQFIDTGPYDVVATFKNAITEALDHLMALQELIKKDVTE